MVIKPDIWLTEKSANSNGWRSHVFSLFSEKHVILFDS